MIMFLRWIFVTKDAHEGSELVTELRNLYNCILHRPGAKQAKKYWNRETPPFRDVAIRTHNMCVEVLKKIEDGERDAKIIQYCIAVGAQVLLPPMRGKPFWSLSVEDNEENSM